MTDVFTPEKRSSVMRQVKGKGTAPEVQVRRLLTAMGLRYRLHRRDLPGAPDIVMAGRKLAICVHGCFWHGHDRARDAANQATLVAIDWTPLVVWECELKDEAAVTARLKAATGG